MRLLNILDLEILFLFEFFSPKKRWGKSARFTAHILKLEQYRDWHSKEEMQICEEFLLKKKKKRGRGTGSGREHA
jgi:hypothetical protein